MQNATNIAVFFATEALNSIQKQLMSVTAVFESSWIISPVSGFTAFPINLQNFTLLIIAYFKALYITYIYEHPNKIQLSDLKS